MRVLMLGWEFPPHLSGGIGTACEGLTKALTASGVDVTFVLPERAGEVDPGGGSVLTTLAPPRGEAGAGAGADPGAGAGAGASGPSGPEVWVADAALAEVGAAARVRPGLGFGLKPEPTPPASPASGNHGGNDGGFTVERVEARIPGAYDAAIPHAETGGTVAGDAGGRLWGQAPAEGPSADADPPAAGSGPSRHAASPAGAEAPPVRSGLPEGELVRQTRRYADACVALARRLAGEAEATGAPGFDAVHAHDWTTFPAGVAVSEALGVPLVVHVHATEFDRSGEPGPGADDPIRRIEAEGLARARRVLAVSHRTAATLTDRYGVDPGRVRVVHNAATPVAAPAESDEAAPGSSGSPDAPAGFTADIPEGDAVVLFLGRLTAQKGPGYFLEAARSVLARRPQTTFVVAGNGDRMEESVQSVRESGLADRFVFTGFLRGDAVRAAYDRADVYVMPSVSEPFGITPLEAAQRGIPVIISKQSGVSEVLDHALKVDFWDTEELANQVLAVLNHPTLGDTLRAHASVQVRGLTWADAAERVVEAYREAAAS